MKYCPENTSDRLRVLRMSKHTAKSYHQKQPSRGVFRKGCSEGKDMIVVLIVGLMKKTLNRILLNAILLYKNESILSKTV